MRADHHLSSGATLHAGEHLREVANYLRMKRQLRLLQQQRTASRQRNPQQSHQAERSVGKLVFILPSAVGRQCSYLPRR